MQVPQVWLLNDLLLWSMLGYAFHLLLTANGAGKHNWSDLLDTVHNCVAWYTFTTIGDLSATQLEALVSFHYAYHIVFVVGGVFLFGRPQDRSDRPTRFYIAGFAVALATYLYFWFTVGRTNAAFNKFLAHLAMVNVALLSAPVMWSAAYFTQAYPLIAWCAYKGVWFLASWPLHELPKLLEHSNKACAHAGLTVTETRLLQFVPAFAYFVTWFFIPPRITLFVKRSKAYLDSWRGVDVQSAVDSSAAAQTSTVAAAVSEANGQQQRTEKQQSSSSKGNGKGKAKAS